MTRKEIMKKSILSITLAVAVTCSLLSSVQTINASNNSAYIGANYNKDAELLCIFGAEFDNVYQNSIITVRVVDSTGKELFSTPWGVNECGTKTRNGFRIDVSLEELGVSEKELLNCYVDVWQGDPRSYLLCKTDIRTDSFVHSGSLGTAKWTFLTNGTLKFSGGPVISSSQFEYADYTPWWPFTKRIERVDFEEGISTIPNRFLLGCSRASSIVLPSTLSKFSSLTFPSSLETDFYYVGSEEQWNTVTGHEYLPKGSNLHFNYVRPNPDQLTFEDSPYYCKKQETISLTATFISDKYPENIKWLLYDKTAYVLDKKIYTVIADGISFNGETSIQGPSVTGIANTYKISRQVDVKEIGNYNVYLQVDGLESGTVIHADDTSSGGDDPPDPSEPDDPINISLEINGETYSSKLNELVQIKASYKGNQIDNFGLEYSDPSAFEKVAIDATPTSEENEYNVIVTLKALKAGNYDVTLKNGALSASINIIVNSDDPPLVDGFSVNGLYCDGFSSEDTRINALVLCSNLIGEEAVDYLSINYKKTSDADNPDDIRWSVSDTDALEILKLEKASIPNTNSVEIKVYLRGNKVGTFTIKGTDPYGRWCETEISVEPKLLLKNITPVITSPTVIDIAEIALPEANEEYLTAYVNDLELEPTESEVFKVSELSSAMKDGKSAVISAEFTPVATEAHSVTFRLKSRYGQSIPFILSNKIKSKNWSEDDEWPFRNDYNTDPYKGVVPNEVDGKYISETDFNRLISHMSVLDKKRVKFDQDGKTWLLNIGGSKQPVKEWNGSCQGIAVTANLIKQGIYSTADIIGSNKNLHDIPADKTIQSFIHYFYIQQYMAYMQNEYRDFMNLNQDEQLMYIENCLLSGKPVVIGFGVYYYNRSSKGVYTPELNNENKHVSKGHAVVAHGIQSGSYEVRLYASDKYEGDKYTFDKRFLIYDSNDPGNEQTYIYYDSDYGRWCLPAYNMLSTGSYTAISEYNNGNLQSCSSDIELLNGVDFITGELSSLAKNAEIDSPRLFTTNAQSVQVNFDGGSATIENAKCNNDKIKVALITDMDEGAITEATVFLPETKNLNVSSVDNALNIGLANNGILFDINSTSGGSAIVNDWSSLDASLNTEAPIQIAITSEEKVMDWNTYSISDPEGNELSVKITEDGIAITGDSLEDVVVVAENDEGSQELELSTDAETIIIKENNGELIFEEANEISIPENAVIEAGNTISLTEKAAGVTWRSSDEKIATVDQNGTVKGIKPGYATVTATTSNGLTASCEVRVLFTDIPAEGKYYSNPVYWAVEKGITNGYTDSDGIIRTFKPQNNCTREAVVTFLWRLAGRPDPKNMNSPFSDVQDKGKYYYKAVLWAAEKGITKGYQDGTFKPNATCLREHVVTFLYRYAGQPNPGVTKNPFNDIRSSDYYYKPVLWAVNRGITNGYSSGPNAGGFGPKLDCLREHVVTFLYRYAR